MKRDWWNKEFQWMVAFGESTTAGAWASSRDRTWPSLLARMISEMQRNPVQLINVGIGANVVSKKSPYYLHASKPCAAERVEKHILSNAPNGTPVLPDLLIISYAINDAMTGTPLELFCEEMEDIIQRVREKTQPLIVLLGPYYITDFQCGGPLCSHADMALFRRYNDGIRELAKKRDCLFVDLLSAYGEADWLVHDDGIHGNDLGHRVVANKIFEVLASNCSGLALETKAREKQTPPWRDEAVLQTDGSE